MATTSLLAGRWGAHMSVVFGMIFAAVAVGFFLTRRDIMVRPERRRVIVRTGWRGIGFERSIPFSSVLSVRVTLLGERGESCVTIVCAEDDLELPPTETPRQHALLLAMTMGVKLVKVYGEGVVEGVEERMSRLYREEDAI
jgi:hypothetical protein